LTSSNTVEHLMSILHRRLWSACLAAGLAAAACETARADLYVVQVGEAGGGTLSNASTATFIKKFADTGGSALSTITLPTAADGANQPLTLSGTSTSEGFLALSANGQYLTLGGYATAPGLTQVPQSTVGRVAGRVEISSGAIDTTTVLTDAYVGAGSGNAGNPRSVVTTNGTDIWMAGTGSPSTTAGVRYTTLGSTTSVQLSESPTNTRVVDIENNQLYVSTGSTNFLGVSTVGSGLPTTAGQTVTLLSGFPTSGTHSSYDFWFKDAATLYVADDSSAANGGGIQKWTESGGTWSLAYTLLNTGAATTGVRGLTGTVVDGNAVLFATTTQTSANRLITVTDTGAGATATDLATAPANTVFRGVQFVSSGPGPILDADFDNDGDVDGNDFLIWQRGLGPGSNATGDANDDGDVDQADLAIWESRFGTVAVAAAAGVPEPSALVLAGVALLAAMRSARRRTSHTV
jgi:hypothetical protein